MQSNSFIGNLVNGVKKRIAGSQEHNLSKAGLNWWKVKFLKHAAPNVLRTHTYKNKTIYYQSPAELLHAMQEIIVEEIYRQELPADALILDCGANIGISVIYLKEKFPHSTVIAFEPDDSNFELLKKNVASFGLQNVSIRKEAVWTENTTLNFKSDGTMGSKIEQTSSTSTVSVKATRLKDLLNQPVGFLKIDIEGAEYEVLKDIQEDLKNVQNMFLEYHGSFSQNKELTHIFNILSQAGFSYYIKEAANLYPHPFAHEELSGKRDYDVQLNIFCFRS